MTNFNDIHDDEKSRLPEDGQEPSGLSPTDITVAGVPVDSPKTGDTDIFDQASRGDDSFIGQTLGNYHILSKLGQGGFGTVYKGRDIKLDRHVAIKFLTAPMNGDNSKLFEREAKILANLSKNGNIVQIYTWGEYRGSNYMVLEYMGNSVQDMLEEHPDGLPLKEALQIISDCCEALEYAHDQGVLHRDIKPANILLDAKTKQTKVCDFGLARFYNKGINSATQTIAGSPPFMSTEQVTGNSLDERSDVYSLGVTLYQLLSGKLPFSGDSHLEIMEKVRSSKGIPLPSQRKDLPKIVYNIVKKARAKMPDDRFQSATEFKKALKLAIDAIDKTGSADSAQLTSTGSVKWKRVAIGVGVAVFLGVAGLSGMFPGGSSSIVAPSVLATAKDHIESGSYSQAESILGPYFKNNADDDEIAYHYAYALHLGGKNNDAQAIAEQIQNQKLKREIEAVLRYSLDGNQARDQLYANAAESANGYSNVLIAMLDLASRDNDQVVSRLKNFDSSSLTFEWQKQRVLQTLGQAYLALNQFDKATSAFDQLKDASNEIVSIRAHNFSDIIEQRMKREEHAAIMEHVDEISESFDRTGEYDSWTSRPLHVRLLDAKVNPSMVGRITEEGLNEFLPSYLNKPLLQGVGRPITLINRELLNEIVLEQHIVSKLGASEEKEDLLDGILGVRHFIAPEFHSFKGEEDFVTFKIINVAKGNYEIIDSAPLPPRGSSRAVWTEWGDAQAVQIRSKLASSYILQGIVTVIGDTPKLNIGSEVGVEEGMIFAVKRNPDSAVMSDYSVRVTGDIGANECGVDLIGFSIGTFPENGWYAEQKVES